MSSYPNIASVVLSDPFISSSRLVQDVMYNTVNATIFSVTCTLSGYPQQVTDDGARFEVSFQMDDGTTLFTTTLMSTSTMTVTINESYIAGQLGKRVCDCYI